MTKFKPEVVILIEPRVSGIIADRVCQQLGFEEVRHVETIGFSGGIWVLWHPSSITFNVSSSSRQFLHLEGASNSMGNFALTTINGSPSVAEREHLWSDICRMSRNIKIPWILVGDFNAMLSSDDKRGGPDFSLSSNRSFIDCCNTSGLSDTRFLGPWATWYRGMAAKRLDRALVNDCWMLNFSFTMVRHLTRLYSDHRTILISCEDFARTRQIKPFRFLAPWLGHKDFKECLSTTWSERSRLSGKLLHLSSKLKKWNSVFERKVELSSVWRFSRGISMLTRLMLLLLSKSY
ncbi:hypothetical protein LINPERHAP2_LOCUS7351 [Linum perenne]